MGLRTSIIYTLIISVLGYVVWWLKKAGALTLITIIIAAIYNASIINIKYYYHNLFTKVDPYGVQQYNIADEVKDIDFETALVHPIDKVRMDSAPQFHPVGLEVKKLPPELKQRLVDVWNKEKHRAKLEELGHCNFGSKFSKDNIQTILPLGYVDPQLNDDLRDYLHTELEKWSNTKLKFQQSYGYRDYKRGAVLTCHVDRFETHIISAIINVSQKVDEPWPLVIWDHQGNKHEIPLDGEEDLIFYESLTSLHGRPYPLKGDSFVNVFFHFYPEDWHVKYAPEIARKLAVAERNMRT